MGSKEEKEDVFVDRSSEEGKKGRGEIGGLVELNSIKTKTYLF